VTWFFFQHLIHAFTSVILLGLFTLANKVRPTMFVIVSVSLMFMGPCVVIYFYSKTK